MSWLVFFLSLGMVCSTLGESWSLARCISVWQHPLEKDSFTDPPPQQGKVFTVGVLLCHWPGVGEVRTTPKRSVIIYEYPL